MFYNGYCCVNYIPFLLSSSSWSCATLQDSDDGDVVDGGTANMILFSLIV